MPFINVTPTGGGGGGSNGVSVSGRNAYMDYWGSPLTIAPGGPLGLPVWESMDDPTGLVQLNEANQPFVVEPGLYRALVNVEFSTASAGAALVTANRPFPGAEEPIDRVQWDAGAHWRLGQGTVESIFAIPAVGQDDSILYPYVVSLGVELTVTGLVFQVTKLL